MAQDLGTPKLQTNSDVTVTIIVTRNMFAPEFVNLPGSESIVKTTQRFSRVFTVEATDKDTEVSCYINLPGIEEGYFIIIVEVY